MTSQPVREVTCPSCGQVVRVLGVSITFHNWRDQSAPCAASGVPAPPDDPVGDGKPWGTPGPGDAAVEPFASWQEQTAAAEALAKAAGLEAPDLAYALTRALGIFHMQPEWTGREIVSGTDDRSIATAQGRWEEVEAERAAQVDAMQEALNDPDVRAALNARAAVPVGDGAPGDGLRERIARTICESDGVDWNHYLTGELDLHSDYRANAGALLSGPLAPTLAALDRVRAELDRQQRTCADCRQGYDDKHTDLRRALRGEQ
jgi:hypothetical protein